MRGDGIFPIGFAVIVLAIGVVIGGLADAGRNERLDALEALHPEAISASNVNLTPSEFIFEGDADPTADVTVTIPGWCESYDIAWADWDCLLLAARDGRLVRDERGNWSPVGEGGIADE